MPRPPAFAELDDPTCSLTPERPEPVVLVHGQGGTVEGFSQLGLVQALRSQGYCVYGISYGRDQSGQYGRSHLSTSADQIITYIESVRARTVPSCLMASVMTTVLSWQTQSGRSAEQRLWS